MAGQFTDQQRSLIKQFKTQRACFLCEALNDAKKWCAAPDMLGDGPRNDQFWLRRFSHPAEKVTECDAHAFLVGFKLAMFVRWDKKKVARLIMQVRNHKFSDGSACVCWLSEKLRHLNNNTNEQKTSAASKIAFFTKPLQEVHIWDQFATRSARFRAWMRAGGDAPLGKGPFTSGDGKHAYGLFSAACAKALEDEMKRPDFQKAVKDFRNYIRQVGGPMADAPILDSSFIERRFLDKLLFWEGSWLATNQ